MGIMGTLLLLATEAGAIASDLADAEGHGIGLNFDILETNLINLAIIIGVLIYFGRGVLGKTLSARQSSIETAIRDAEKRKRDASSALADQQQKLAQAKTEAARIRAAADESANAARDSILAQAQEDVERMRTAAVQDLNAQQDRVIRELRQRVSTLAMQKAETQLQERLSESSQQALIDKSIAMLGG
jgi:F-type H+-transporting ATPase subunit b